MCGGGGGGRRGSPLGGRMTLACVGYLPHYSMYSITKPIQMYHGKWYGMPQLGCEHGGYMWLYMAPTVLGACVKLKRDDIKSNQRNKGVGSSVIGSMGAVVRGYESVCVCVWNQTCGTRTVTLSC